MKLLTKNNLYYLLFSLITYFVIAVTFYFVVEHLIYQEVEDRLIVEKKDFEIFVERQGDWKEGEYFVEDKVSVSPSKEMDFNHLRFKDTLLINKYTRKYVPFRQIEFYVQIGNKRYHVEIRKSLLESEKLIKYITTSMLLLLTCALSIMLFLQRRMAKKIWLPFYDTLFKIKSLQLSDVDQDIMLQSGNIFEFIELNDVLNKMIKKMRLDYSSLKEFTENASHELQTPLALINGRVEQLIQSENLSEEQMYWIQEIYQSSNRISKMQSALLLLSKIENNQFTGFEKIDLRKFIQNKLLEYQEMFEFKKLKVEFPGSRNLVFELNPILADILFNNLINNAVKHNVEKGNIIVEILDKGFSISNTGLPMNSDPERLFERFKKASNSDSLGLGLAIVKKICDNYELNIKYAYLDNFHVIRVLIIKKVY